MKQSAFCNFEFYCPNDAELEEMFAFSGMDEQGQRAMIDEINDREDNIQYILFLVSSMDIPMSERMELRNHYRYINGFISQEEHERTENVVAEYLT